MVLFTHGLLPAAITITLPKTGNTALQPGKGSDMWITTMPAASNKAPPMESRLAQGASSSCLMP